MRKILTLLLVCVLIFTFAACSAALQSEDTPELPVQANTEAAEQTQAPEAQPEETAPKQAGISSGEAEPTEQMPTEEMPAEETSAEEEAIQEKLVQMEQLLAQYVDLSHYDIDQPDIDRNEYALQSAFKPANYNDWPPADGYITIDGNVKITTGETKVSDLLAAGWDFAEAEAAENYDLGAMRTVGSPSLYKDDKEIRVGLANPTEETVKWKDAYIDYIVLEQCEFDRDNGCYIALSTATDFDIDGKLNQDSQLADIIHALGEPGSVLCYVVDSRSEKSYFTIEYGPVIFKVTADGAQIVEFTCY